MSRTVQIRTYDVRSSDELREDLRWEDGVRVTKMEAEAIARAIYEVTLIVEIDGSIAKVIDIK